MGKVGLGVVHGVLSSNSNRRQLSGNGITSKSSSSNAIINNDISSYNAKILAEGGKGVLMKKSCRASVRN